MRYGLRFRVNGKNVSVSASYTPLPSARGRGTSLILKLRSTFKNDYFCVTEHSIRVIFAEKAHVVRELLGLKLVVAVALKGPPPLPRKRPMIASM